MSAKIKEAAFKNEVTASFHIENKYLIKKR